MLSKWFEKTGMEEAEIKITLAMMMAGTKEPS